ncbi:hypothetical protein BDV95DRAFT_602077 [Massariosphaeria phaeospora]|uniref:Uncharacterized protein n=1 Tax=Massariosphaeria phaeospora TaxID=100035 RepID=A0A7C8MHK2_9PLEO|nr:hypothetical protein BDV95DRAFT_602077 [Massariosphaeria phaeospora]
MAMNASGGINQLEATIQYLGWCLIEREDEIQNLKTHIEDSEHDGLHVLLDSVMAENVKLEVENCKLQTDIEAAEISHVLEQERLVAENVRLEVEKRKLQRDLEATERLVAEKDDELRESVETLKEVYKTYLEMKDAMILNFNTASRNFNTVCSNFNTVCRDQNAAYSVLPPAIELIREKNERIKTLEAYLCSRDLQISLIHKAILNRLAQLQSQDDDGEPMRDDHCNDRVDSSGSPIRTIRPKL